MCTSKLTETTRLLNKGEQNKDIRSMCTSKLTETTRLLNKGEQEQQGIMCSCTSKQRDYEHGSRHTYVSRYLVSNEEGYFGVQVAKVLFLPEVFFALETDLVFQLLDFNLG